MLIARKLHVSSFDSLLEENVPKRTAFLHESAFFMDLADRLLLILVVEAFEQEITTFLQEKVFS